MRIELFVPTRDHTGSILPGNLVKAEQEKAVRALIEAFGGVTSTWAEGHYLTKNSQIISETVNVLTVYTERSRAAEQLLPVLAQGLKDKLSQESVLYTIDGILHFV